MAAFQLQTDGLHYYLGQTSNALETTIQRANSANDEQVERFSNDLWLKLLALNWRAWHRPDVRVEPLEEALASINGFMSDLPPSTNQFVRGNLKLANGWLELAVAEAKQLKREP